MISRLRNLCIAVLTIGIFSPLLAFASPQILINWSDTTGTGRVGGPHIRAEAGDRLTARVFLRANEFGVSRYSVSVRFDEDGLNELDLVSVVALLPPGFDSVGGPGLPTTFESSPGTPGGIGRISADTADLNGPASTLIEIASIEFDVNVPSTDGYDLRVDLIEAEDIILDNRRLSLTPGLLGARLAVHAAIPQSARVAVETFVRIGAVNNPADPTTGLGSVSYEYFIAPYEVTNDQYVEFLNAVDPLGVNALMLYALSQSTSSLGGILLNLSAAAGEKYTVKKDGEGQHPVNFVSWLDSARFVNWLENGSLPGGDTEMGSYNLLATPPSYTNGGQLVLPTHDEWYKAAYRTPAGNNWTTYPGGGTPTEALCDEFGQVTNSGYTVTNFFGGATGSCDAPVRVGASGHDGGWSDSGQYIFDLGGNVGEWLEPTSLLFGVQSALVRGGGALSTLNLLARTIPIIPIPLDSASAYRGFRVGFVSNDPSDFDLDGIVDAGLPYCSGGQTTNCSDNCVSFKNSDQADADGDRVGDACDNCPYSANPRETFATGDARQRDLDRDGLGDVCDADMDGDFIPNSTDTDIDGDSVLNVGGPPCDENQNVGCNDICPLEPNWNADSPDPAFPLGQRDCDQDDVGDHCDCRPYGANGDDQDGDGVGSLCDVCPSIPDPDQSDFDGDRIGDICDLCPLVAEDLSLDTDSDGIGDACDVCPFVADPSQVDSDFDGVGDACDLGVNSDGDAVPDTTDNCPLVFQTDFSDTDMDGIGDACDPSQLGGTFPQIDPFLAGEQQVCSLDTDNDQEINFSQGATDFRWLYEGTESVGQCIQVGDLTNGGGGSGTGAVNWSYVPAGSSGADCCVYRLAIDAVDPSPDVVMLQVEFGGATLSQANQDGDEILDACDNCPAIDNQYQEDADFDGTGDVCDNCNGVPNPDQADSDGDGLGDACDGTPVPEPSFGLGLAIAIASLSSLWFRRPAT